MCKEAGKPLPRFSNDDFIDYVVTEAVVAKYWQHEKAASKQQTREEWQRRPFGSG